MTDINIGAITEVLNEKLDLDAHNLDSTGKEYVGSMAIPSSSYIDYVFPANNGTVTAPADGYFTWSAISTGVAQYLSVANITSHLKTTTQNLPNTCYAEGFMPVAKGDKIALYYNIGNPVSFVFVYAKGSE